MIVEENGKKRTFKTIEVWYAAFVEEANRRGCEWLPTGEANDYEDFYTDEFSPEDAVQEELDAGAADCVYGVKRSAGHK